MTINGGEFLRPRPNYSGEIFHQIHPYRNLTLVKCYLGLVGNDLCCVRLTPDEVGWVLVCLGVYIYYGVYIYIYISVC